MTIDPFDLLRQLEACPAGIAGWRQFEDVCVDILRYLFVPPLGEPMIEQRSFSGIDRRDAIFPNRNMDTMSIWGQLRHELNARLVLFEFKNYDAEEIGKDEVDQTRNYLTRPMGRLAIVCCNKEPSFSALLRRNQVYTQDEKVILFLMPKHLREMIFMRERGDDPARLLMDLLELFYVQHE